MTTVSRGGASSLRGNAQQTGNDVVTQNPHTVKISIEI